MIKVSDHAKEKAIQLMTEDGFKPFEDFINNAKIGNELLKDIWENVVDISVF